MPPSKISKSLEERKEEADTVKYFAELVRQKFKTGNFTVLQEADYEVERKMLSKVGNSGWTEGAIAGVLTIIFLQRNSLFGRRRQFGRSPFSPAKTVMPPKLNPWFRLGEMFLNVSVSVTVGLFTSAFFTDKQMVMQTVAKAPLVEGRSALSDEFCPDLVRAYHEIHPPEYWKGVESPILQTLRDFCENCQRRAAFEQVLRSERGLNKSDAICIPSPGVPTDYTVDTGIVSMDDDDNTFDNYFRADETTIVTSSDDDDDWAKSFVTDQEQMDGDIHDRRNNN